MSLMLVGCGKHARTTILPALEAMGKSPTILCDIDPDRARVGAGLIRGTPTIRLDWREALKLEPSRVIVAVSPATHEEVAAACLEANIPVLIQKPPARSTDAALALVRLGLNRSPICDVGFNYRHAPAIAVLKRYITEEFDHVIAANIRFFSRHPTVREWGARSILESWIYGNGIHAMDLIHFLFGKPDWVRARFAGDADGTFAMTSEFGSSSGALINLEIGNATPAFQFEIQIRNDAGRMIAMRSLAVVEGTPGGRDGADDLRVANAIWSGGTSTLLDRGYVNELEAFLHVGTRVSVPSIVDGAWAMAMCDGLVASAETGRPEMISPGAHSRDVYSL